MKKSIVLVLAGLIIGVGVFSAKPVYASWTTDTLKYIKTKLLETRGWVNTIKARIGAPVYTGQNLMQDAYSMLAWMDNNQELINNADTKLDIIDWNAWTACAGAYYSMGLDQNPEEFVFEEVCNQNGGAFVGQTQTLSTLSDKEKRNLRKKILDHLKK